MSVAVIPTGSTSGGRHHWEPVIVNGIVEQQVAQGVIDDRDGVFLEGEICPPICQIMVHVFPHAILAQDDEVPFVDTVQDEGPVVAERQVKIRQVDDIDCDRYPSKF